MKIIFTGHAEFKFRLLVRHGFKISETQISNIVRNPTNTWQGKKGRLIVQSPLDKTHVMRVICEIEGEEVRVITFYPARRDRYENQL